MTGRRTTLTPTLVGALLCLLSAHLALGHGGRRDGGLSRCPSSYLLPSTTKMVSHPYNNKCYQFVHSELYWTQARDYCRRYGGRLVTLPDAATNAFILRALNALTWKNRGVWIGLHDRADELVWEWSTESYGVGEKVTWTNWGRGHPRSSFHGIRDCVRMVRGSGTWRWHETPCALLNWKYRFICQYEMMPSTAAHQGLTSPATPRATTRRSTTTTAPTPTSTPTTTTFRYGVGSDGEVNALNGDALKGGKTPTTPREGATTEGNDVIDVVVPLQLQQNDNDGHTNMLGGVVVACLIMVLLSLLVIIVVYFRRRRQKKALASSLNVSNPSYCSATCGSIVAANGQTTLLKLKATQDNEYTDEPLKGIGFIPAPYKDDVTMTNEEEYEEVKASEDLAGNILDQNEANNAAEKQQNVNHVYADPYDVPSKKPVQLRPRMPTPSGHYLPMDSKRSGVTGRTRVASEGYMEPVSSAPRVSNIYAEIPEDDDDTYPLTENVYETLEDLEKNRQNAL